MHAGSTPTTTATTKSRARISCRGLFVNPVTRTDRTRFTVGMSNDRAYEDIHDPADLAALQQQEAERAQIEKIAASNTAAGDTGDFAGRSDGETVTNHAGTRPGSDGDDDGSQHAGDPDTTDAGDGVQGADPDLSVPGESDTAASGGQGADDRYRDGELGGGAIGGAVDDDKETR